MTRTLPIAGLVTALALVASCTEALLPPTSVQLAVGSWGGENAGMIVDDSTAHVHVGCTYGNFPMPVTLDGNGRFETNGSYVLRAYPIAIGPSLPARFTGRLDRNELTFTVTVTDTVAKSTVVLGPATVEYGREPKLGPCPICAVIPAMR